MLARFEVGRRRVGVPLCRGVAGGAAASFLTVFRMASICLLVISRSLSRFLSSSIIFPANLSMDSLLANFRAFSRFNVSLAVRRVRTSVSSAITLRICKLYAPFNSSISPRNWRICSRKYRSDPVVPGFVGGAFLVLGALPVFDAFFGLDFAGAGGSGVGVVS